MTLPGWLAALVLFLQLPIPLYWFVVHPLVRFWRRHQKAAYITGVLCSWPPVTLALVVYRRELFRREWPSGGAIATGLFLIIVEAWMFWRVHRDLGTSRLVGRTELSGSGEIAHRGIYARIRHPRYTGSFLAIIGACLLAGTRVTWMVAGVWMMLTLLAISFEERELRARFGATYEAYCRRVPRFLPLPGRSRD
ncbi:MAG TPA: isoprenylcysteine carboxylmethyltransferase family protein [Candidatus Polarisedimenticolia bacterium]|nr:isoprenylcysteine carboxylmethyltransferase family protein [Candidatus Polarisedimenticolia bacterium]